MKTLHYKANEIKTKHYKANEIKIKYYKTIHYIAMIYAIGTKKFLLCSRRNPGILGCQIHSRLQS